MLNNIFINENNLNKFSARSKQTDPTMALDQASSFAGALANQVSINQNNNSNIPAKPNNSNQTPNQTSNTSSNTTQQATNTTKPSENSEPTSANNNIKAESNTNKPSNEAKSDKASQTNNQAKNQSDNKNIADAAPKNNNVQAIKLASNKDVDLVRNLVANVTGQELNNDKGKSSAINVKDLPQNFQKIIANLQNRNSKSDLSNTKGQVNNKAISKSDKNDLTTDDKKTNLHQSQIKSKSRLVNNDLQLNNKFKSTQESIKIEQRNISTTNDKIIAAANTQTKELINNHLVQGFERQSETESTAHNPNNALNNNPAFGLAATSTTSIPTNNANLQQGLIPSHINNPQWGNDLGRQMASMIRIAENGTHTAQLRLDPPELGPLRVTINLNDGIVNAVFSSMHANVRNAIEQSLPQLQQQLQQEGLSLGQADVGQDNQDSQHAQNNNSSKGNSLLTQDQESISSDNISAQNQNRAINPDALLDTYA